ncbi:hypothetical protein GCM10022237_47560 [Nocardioides ginsengisoli]|uniref:Maltokinase N-terminal cap domain-containing protein n=1 Tax=Nocardioides ginsengisoli TaxID=363868 RepID=A0ABW3W1Z7_9ACTN
MAIVHRATLTPSKQELLTAWLPTQDWAGPGEVEILGAYRYDDPEGEVGVEAFIVRLGERLLHVPVTYRGAPYDDADLIGTLEHSVLGHRWAYDGTTDAVALGCFARALAGEQEQAQVELWDDEQRVHHLPLSVTVALEGEPGEGKFRILHEIVAAVDAGGAARIVATWDGGSGAVAVLA